MTAFDASALIRRLSHGGAWVRALTDPLTLEEMQFVPSHGAWSVAEILGHLADEETEDFRIRVRSTLEDPTPEWPPIDPEGSVRTRGYRRRDPAESRRRFVRERQASVEWLCKLQDPDWCRAYEHPRWGPIHAGTLLASWAAHDALHIRQIAKRLHELAARDGGEFSTIYAGEWGA
jgi:hypothetical protein